MDQGPENSGLQQAAQSVDATTAILTARGTSYGDYTTHAELAQRLKEVYRSAPGWERLSANQKETMDMTAHKQARILNGNPNVEDSWADIAGYNRLSADRVRK